MLLRNNVAILVKKMVTIGPVISELMRYKTKTSFFCIICISIVNATTLHNTRARKPVKILNRLRSLTPNRNRFRLRLSVTGFYRFLRETGFS